MQHHYHTWPRSMRAALQAMDRGEPVADDDPDAVIGGEAAEGKGTPCVPFAELDGRRAVLAQLAHGPAVADDEDPDAVVMA